MHRMWLRMAAKFGRKGMGKMEGKEGRKTFHKEFLKSNHKSISSHDGAGNRDTLIPI